MPVYSQTLTKALIYFKSVSIRQQRINVVEAVGRHRLFLAIYLIKYVYGALAYIFELKAKALKIRHLEIGIETALRIYADGQADICLYSR